MTSQYAPDSPIRQCYDFFFSKKKLTPPLKPWIEIDMKLNHNGKSLIFLKVVIIVIIKSFFTWCGQNVYCFNMCMDVLTDFPPY